MAEMEFASAYAEFAQYSLVSMSAFHLIEETLQKQVRISRRTGLFLPLRCLSVVSRSPGRDFVLLNDRASF